ncbi:BTB/POZ domain-containing adapter for CUL3-mediated RhoA degradation protein 3 [Acipenser ruthenus]|uniref:BTB/POZ domain-containing adapter for CUL3-mediated RhoA degradation protein 3 n=1 Tax=Acipenser ruthenus TaxID=7906 RepID=A0A444V4A2_ACIRT|nr:BTB/POZ domain-containing adapter for CUL3-mediated RhoA degradation protein 3 [Acipenser ruthenus]
MRSSLTEILRGGRARARTWVFPSRLVRSVLFLDLMNKDTYEPFCKVPVITSSKEEQRLIATSNKVEFPEARIYEETLNILLYEAQDGRGPDNALLEATGGAAGRSSHLDEDEERERIERVRRIHVKRPDDRTHLHQ